MYQEEVFLCGERSCPAVSGTQLECLNPLTLGVEPNPDELLVKELGYGLLNYQDIGHALLVTTIQIFNTGTFALLGLMKQALPRVVADLYYCSFMLLM